MMQEKIRTLKYDGATYRVSNRRGIIDNEKFAGCSLHAVRDYVEADTCLSISDTLTIMRAAKTLNWDGIAPLVKGERFYIQVNCGKREPTETNRAPYALVVFETNEATFARIVTAWQGESYYA